MDAGSQRWPPVVALIIGFLMVFVALPNPLRIPNNNPGSTAELAPVPGDEESSLQGNFGETGLAQSGLGSGFGQTPPPVELPPGQEVPVDKECVGDPPRQTEDPLSPPCVPYWSGRNGGTTWQGVTGQEVSVVLLTDIPLNGDPNGPYQNDTESNRVSEGYNLVKTIAAHMRYFQRRFQTYGRHVHVTIENGSPSSDGAARRRKALGVQFKYHPFGTTFLGNEASHYFAQLAEYGVFSFGLNEDVDTDLIAEAAPYMWSFYPDQEVEARWSAGFICRALLGRDGPGDDTRLPARYAKDRDLRDKPRKIGFIFNEESQRGPEIRRVADRLQEQLLDVCGFEFDLVEPIVGNPGGNAARIIAKMKLDGITTIVCYCIPVPGEVQAGTFQNAATGADYHPEWYWDHMSRMDKPLWQQIYGSKEQFSLGTSYYWRMPAFREQQWQVAYREETRDGSVPNARWGFNVYYQFLNLFTAIQAAGPELNKETIERGMFTFRFLRPSYPWLPTGSYGTDGPGTYTFIDTGMAWWWDPTGTPPGGKQGEGCQRVSLDGRRFYAEQWPIGDAWVVGSDDPCTEDRQRLTDPQPGDY